jgi:hypothetical protein
VVGERSAVAALLGLDGFVVLAQLEDGGEWWVKVKGAGYAGARPGLRAAPPAPSSAGPCDGLEHPVERLRHGHKPPRGVGLGPDVGRTWHGYQRSRVSE